MRFVLLAVSFFAAVVTRAPALAQRAAPCYRYDSDSVVLKGHVVRRVYPGRPNYESVKAGDEPDTVFVLQLDRPLCTTATEIHEARKNVREVQLYFSKADAPAVRALRGRPAVLRGTLEGAVWGWHHLAVLLHLHMPPVRVGPRAV